MKKNTKDMISLAVGISSTIAGVWIVVDHGGWMLLLGLFLLALGDRVGRW